MHNKQDRNVKIALFGAAPDTPNMGVSALFASTLSGIKKQIPSAEFIVFDNGLGRRHGELNSSNDIKISYQQFGARGGKRYTTPENLATMRAMASLGKFGAKFHEAISLIDSCDAVLDVSGGDSFSDIYGSGRFFSVVRPKLIALKRRIPLILLPQTYGPFIDEKLHQLAAKTVQGAEMAWARDQHSFTILKSMLGDQFDSERHKCGVDLALGLEPRPAKSKLDEKTQAWISDKNTDPPLVGLNINGLIYNSPEKAKSHYQFKADYADTLDVFLRWLIDEKKARIVLIPHVMDAVGHYESDLEASINVAARLGTRRAKQIAISPTTLDQSQVKWVISQMDWFCGTRMHSTIASLSSKVPTASIAYSDKTKGVFESCGQGDKVVDPREQETHEVIDRLKRSFETREHTRETLTKHLPEIEMQAAAQMEAIAKHVLVLHSLNTS